MLLLRLVNGGQRSGGLGVNFPHWGTAALADGFILLLPAILMIEQGSARADSPHTEPAAQVHSANEVLSQSADNYSGITELPGRGVLFGQKQILDEEEFLSDGELI